MYSIEMYFLYLYRVVFFCLLKSAFNNKINLNDCEATNNHLYTVLWDMRTAICVGKITIHKKHLLQDGRIVSLY
jgi:hypothetical protein